MSNMKLIIESWRSFIAESVDTDISDAVSKNVALFKAEKDNLKFYILYNPIHAMERLKHYTDYNGQYKNPPKDNYTNLNPFREAVQDSILSIISLKPSTGGKKNTGPYDAKEVNSVVSNKKGFGRILYVISMADHALLSDRGGNVTKFAQDVWRDFYNNSQEIEKEPKTGNLSRETFPEDGIVKIKIDNINKPETETKEDDGEVYVDRGSNDPLNYVYFNLSKDKNAISALQQNHEEFIRSANSILADFNKTIEQLRTQFRVPLSNSDSFMEAATSTFRKRYKEIPDAIKYVTEEVSKALEEKWSEKYKRSIDCKNPKGFSQRAHCQGRKKNEGNDPKVGTGKKPEGSGRRLYTDENPKDTVSVKFSTVQDIKDTLSKESFKSKPHARQSQIINLIHQRVRAAYQNAKDPEVKARLKKAYEYAEQRKEASKEKTASLQKEEQDVQLNEKCWEGYTQKGMKTMFGKKYPNCVKKTNEEVELEERKLGKPSSETNLGDWFKRKGAPGKKGGWVDCNTCRDGKCKPCGRQEGEKRSKYPRCRPTPAQCKGYKRRGDNLQKEE